MSSFKTVWKRIRSLSQRREVKREIDEELRFHVEQRTAEIIAAGMSPEEAAQEARKRFGNMQNVREECREASGASFGETILQDIRFGLRMLRKNPGFTIVAMLTLALGIGANTAIFSLINGLLLRPLPYHQPNQLVSISETSAYSFGEAVAAPHFLDWVEQSRLLGQFAAYSAGNRTLTAAGEPERLDVCRVSAGFFPLLGVEPLLGFGISGADDRPAAARVAVISHSLWLRRFSADRNVIGQTIKLDDLDYLVVGILPPDFRFLRPFDACIPLALDPVQERGNQQISSVSVIAQLKHGINPTQAQVELNSIVDRGRQPNRPVWDGHVRLVSLHDKLVGNTRGVLWILLCAVNLILLIACTNVANLLLSRGAARQKEFAIRTALGARRAQLIRQMMTEGGLLALGGAVLGLFLAVGLLRLVMGAAMQSFGDIARLASIQLDWHVLGFTLLVSGVAALLFGLVPALQLSRPAISNWLKERGQSGGFNRHRLRRLFMLVEIALSIILLTGAGLLVRSFANLMEVNPGYQSRHLLTMRVSLPESRYAERSQREGFYQDLLRYAATLPGVEAAGAINHLPLSSFMFQGALRIPGQVRPVGENPPATPIGIVTPDYFRAMGIPLRSGRVFTDRDNSNVPRVVIVSEALARTLFPNSDPLGKQLWVPGPGGGNPIVVGVVGDIKHQGLDKEVTPQVYLPNTQFGMPSMAIVVRTTGAPLSLAGALRREVARMDPNLPVYDLQTMEARLADSIASRRVNLLLLALFASLALLLAAVGIYGVFSYAVTQRMQEFGVRMALGAGRATIMGMVVRECLALTTAGIAVGVAASLGATRVMANLLYGVKPNDPITYALVCLVMLGIALLATWLPAWRAARVDPIVALRCE